MGMGVKADAAVDYALSVLLPGKGAEEQALRRAVRYASEPETASRDASIQIIPSRFFDEGVYATSESLPVLPLDEINGVPLLFGTPNVERRDDRLVVHADIIASAYFLLTRYEEAVRRDVREGHGRFPGRESVAFRAGFIHRPVVDEYAALLRKWLRAVGIDVPEPRRSFSVLLTHDVDYVAKYYKRLHALRAPLGALLRRRPFSDVPEALGVALGVCRDPYDTFETMIEWDTELRSSGHGPHAECVYFLMAGGKTAEDGRYHIRDRKSRRLIRRVLDSGAVIGLHASYDAAFRPELIAEERAELEEVCGFPIRRNRWHCLAWREIEDGWALAKAGIDWDSTLIYHDVAGFRLGVCRPVPLFDPIRMKPFGIEEHPLIVMDGTLCGPRDTGLFQMGLDEQAAFDCCVRLIQETRKHDGEFVMLWHNTSLAPGYYPTAADYHRSLYRRLLRVLAGEDVGSARPDTAGPTCRARARSREQGTEVGSR